MATMEINCINSFSFPQYHPNSRGWYYMYDKNKNRLPGSGYTIVMDADYNNGVQEFGGVGSYALRNSETCACYVFNQTDLSFLDTSQINSITLTVTIAMQEQPNRDNFAIDLLALGVRPEFLEGYYYDPDDDVDPYWYMWYADAGLSRDLDYDENTLIRTIDGEMTPGRQVSIDLTNAVDIAKRIVANGIAAYSSFSYNTTCALFGGNSPNRPKIVIDYTGSTEPPTVTPASPVSVVIDGGQPVTFRWNYSQAVSAPQSHFQLQQLVNSVWTNITGKTAGSQNNYTAPANTFSPGQGTWRVMVWSNNGTIASAWSPEAYVIVQSTPSAPNITNAGTSPSPTFTWQAAQQQGYEIILGDYTTGTVYGVEKSWTYPGVLPDGPIAFSVRVQNAQGEWSPWSNTQTTIKNIPQGSITLSAQARGPEASLVWTPSQGQTFGSYLIWRNGEAIARETRLQYVDYLGAGRCTYQVYGMLTGGYYTPSEQVTEMIFPRHAVLSAVDPIEWIVLKLRSGGRPTYQQDLSAQVSFVHYQGRRLPVAYVSGFQDSTHTFAFSLNDRDAYLSMLALLGQEVILKTARGDRVIGILTGVTAERARASDFTLSITETDYKEDVLHA